MPSLNRVQTQSMRGVGFKIDFLMNKVTGPHPMVYVGDSATWLKVVNYSGRLNINRNEVIRLEGLFKTNNDLMVPAIELLEKWEAGYYSTFLNGNSLLIFPNSDRARIGLNVENDITPPRGNYPDIMNTGALVISGDALRIAAGSAPMAVPTIAAFTLKYTPANLYYNTNSDLAVLLIAARKAVSDMLAEGIALCNKTDKEIEVHFDEGDKPAMRHNSEYWGVHYSSSTPISYFALTVLETITNIALEHVILFAHPGLEEGETNEEGYDSMNIHTFGTVTVNYTLTGYFPGSVVFETEEGETIVRTLFLTPIPPPPPVV